MTKYYQVIYKTKDFGKWFQWFNNKEKALAFKKNLGDKFVTMRTLDAKSLNKWEIKDIESRIKKKTLDKVM